MAEALYTLEGAICISLGTQTPLMDIKNAAEAHQANVVAISISEAFPARHVAPLLTQLRGLLPEQVSLWAGGAGMLRQPQLPGTVALATLNDAMAILHDWRAAQASKQLRPGDDMETQGSTGSPVNAQIPQLPVQRVFDREDLVVRARG